MKSIAIIGVSGAIGKSFLREVKRRHPVSRVYGFSRLKPNEVIDLTWHHIDLTDEATIEEASSKVTEPLDLVILATGILHNTSLQPEKSLRDLSIDNFERVFKINTIGPALIAKYFLPKLNRKSRSVFAALSARVGSIEDNNLGGWYAYRASKAALNMIIKTASIEIARRNKHAIIAGLHPGTVDSNLSKPFQANVPDGKLFTADYSANKLLDVLEGLSGADSGHVFDFNGIKIPS